MYNIYTTAMVFERCVPDKPRIDSIIPHAVLHFVLSGEGYINGKKVTKNTVFISFENNRMNYAESLVRKFDTDDFSEKTVIRFDKIHDGMNYHLELTDEWKNYFERINK